MDPYSAIYQASGLDETSFKFSLFHNKEGLNSDFTCVLANDDTDEKSLKNIYVEPCLLRLLAAKSDLMTKQLLDQVYETTVSEKMALIINWGAKNYAYMLMTLDQQRGQECFDTLTANYPNIVARVKEVLRSTNS